MSTIKFCLKYVNLDFSSDFSCFILDLVLCSYTMPITLWQILRGSTKWPFGPETKWACGFVVSAQAVPLFMSSMAIVAIAWDRYRCVLHNVRQVACFFLLLEIF